MPKKVDVWKGDDRELKSGLWKRDKTGRMVAVSNAEWKKVQDKGDWKNHYSAGSDWKKKEKAALKKSRADQDEKAIKSGLWKRDKKGRMEPVVTPEMKKAKDAARAANDKWKREQANTANTLKVPPTPKGGDPAVSVGKAVNAWWKKKKAEQKNAPKTGGAGGGGGGKGQKRVAKGDSKGGQWTK
jgi:hypothetical protein